jgi:hypothetical protein
MQTMRDAFRFADRLPQYVSPGEGPEEPCRFYAVFLASHSLGCRPAAGEPNGAARTSERAFASRAMSDFRDRKSRELPGTGGTPWMIIAIAVLTALAVVWYILSLP